MPLVPRIVIVDAAGEVARIVRGALALLNRQSILIEVPTSGDALEEIANSSVDLVVTAYQLPGEQNGIELAHHINHETLHTPVIVLARESDPQPDGASVENAPFQYFVRPTAEPFLRGMRVALDGESVVQVEMQPVTTAIDLGPIPLVDLAPIRDVIIGLIRDVGAMGIILSDRNGRVLIDEGATGYIDRETMAAVMGPMFARVSNISPLVGGDAWAMHYYNGERLDVYGLSLGVHYVLGLVFEGANRRAMAAVMLYGRQAAHQIIDMIGDGAYQTGPVTAAASAPEKPEPVVEKKAPEPVKAEIRKTPAAKPLPKFEEEDAMPELDFDALPDLDVDALFGQGIDESMADMLFDPDELSDLAASIDADDESRVGYDEAIDMGILDD